MRKVKESEKNIPNGEERRKDGDTQDSGGRILMLMSGGSGDRRPSFQTLPIFQATWRSHVTGNIGTSSVRLGFFFIPFLIQKDILLQFNIDLPGNSHDTEDLTISGLAAYCPTQHLSRLA
jgi:hypothetical protein